ncbi:Tetratricopeptide-like helical domain superfamily [Sesbania bispinosa]|nr:Tetratricopeptide-like helical domain superfamily [Sesbania bispinosa]
MPDRNHVSWTVMISGLERNKMIGVVRKYFDLMPYKDIVAWSAMITAYFDEELANEACELFNLMSEKNFVTWSAMIDGYVTRWFRANYVLELDFEPFNASFPRPTRSPSIGNGVQFLNRHLSSFMFRNEESLDPLLQFLRAHKYDGHAMMLNDRIHNISKLQYSLAKAEEFLSKLLPNTPYSDFEYEYVGIFKLMSV